MLSKNVKSVNNGTSFFLSSLGSLLRAQCSVHGQDPGAGTSVTLANETQDAALSIDDVTTSDVMP